MAQARLTEIPANFYRTTMGTEPVADWLRRLSAEDRRVIGVDLCTVQFGWPLGMPLCRPLGDGLWEVRSNLAGRRIARLLFFVDQGRIGVVHGFIKTTQKTPPVDLALARRRMKEMKA
jgi:phage-related protein